MAWPASLPQSFESSTYQASPQTGTIRTTMSTGPNKVRRRFSAVANQHSGAIIMTKALFVSDFQVYYHTTLIEGTAEFDFPDPLGGSALTVRFVGVYSWKQYSPTDVLVSFTLEEMP